jgi:hypothetical protein
MGTGSFPGVKCGRGVLLTTHPSSDEVMEEYSPSGPHRPLEGLLYPIYLSIDLIINVLLKGSACSNFLQSVNFLIHQKVHMTVVEQHRISKDNFIVDPLELWCKIESFRD